MTPLRVVVADAEPPADGCLLSIIRGFEELEVVGVAASGAAYRRLIECVAPDLAFIDLDMPDLDGIRDVASRRQGKTPLVAFVSADEAHAVRAFELNAIDYLRKPVGAERLRHTIDRALGRLRRAEARATAAGALQRIPVRCGGDIVLVPVEHVVSVVSDAELLRLTTRTGEQFTITYRLKDLEARLDTLQFVRISRGTLLNLASIQKITPASGGTFVATLHSGARHQVSRACGRILRDQLLRL